jgi:hypothetical protein
VYWRLQLKGQSRKMLLSSLTENSEAIYGERHHMGWRFACARMAYRELSYTLQFLDLKEYGDSIEMVTDKEIGGYDEMNEEGKKRFRSNASMCLNQNSVLVDL